METITVVTVFEEDAYVAHCLEYDIASQGDTRQEAMANIKEAVELFLDYATSAEIQGRLANRGQVDTLSLNRA